MNHGADRDHPDVIVFPPVIALAMVVMAVALQWLWPLGWIAAIGTPWRIAAGIVGIATGVLLAAVAQATLIRRGTNVLPSRPALTLVTDGIFGRTRNPIYLAGGPVLLGVALLADLDWLPLLMPPGFWLLHWGIVRREEDYLEAKFGDGYRRYQAAVPRYLWRA